MAAIELVKMYAMDNPCESDIFRTISPVYFKLKISFHIIKGWTLFTFRPSAINKMAPIKLFKLYAMDNPFELDIFRTFYPMDFKHERGRTLLSLGHLLKTRWPPSDFLKCMLHWQALWTRYLKNHFTNWLQIWFMMSYYLKERHFWFWPFC